MSKKLTKTIILIVFVVFLGINKVNAASDSNIYKTCTYGYSSPNKEISVSIMKDFQQIKVESVNLPKTIKGDKHTYGNWDKNHVSKNYTTSEAGNFYAGEVFKSSGQTCPPAVLYAGYETGAALFFFKDDGTNFYTFDLNDNETVAITNKLNTNVNRAIVQAAEDDKVFRTFNPAVYPFKSETIGPAGLSEIESSDSNDSNDSNANGAQPTLHAISCQCKATFDNGTYLEGVVNVKGDLNSPTINLNTNLTGGNSESESILNWSKLPDEFKNHTTFTYMDYFTNSSTPNRCPDYMILAVDPNTEWYQSIVGMKTGEARLYLSDASNYDKITKAIASTYSNYKTYTAGCQQIFITGNNSGSSENENNPEIEANVGSLENDLATYSCGGDFITGLPSTFIRLVHTIYNFLQFLVPLVVIILGILDLVKAITSQKEDEIKKGQSTFFKRLIGAVMVFFVFAIVKLVISIVSSMADTQIIPCINCFLQGTGSSYCQME